MAARVPMTAVQLETYFNAYDLVTSKPHAEWSLNKAVEFLCEQRADIHIELLGCSECKSVGQPCVEDVTCGYRVCKTCILDSLRNFAADEGVGARLRHMKCPMCGAMLEYEQIASVIGETEIDALENKRIEMMATPAGPPLYPCAICMEEKKVEDVRVLSCKHIICDSCLKRYLHEMIRSRRVNEKDLSCPACGTEIKADIINNVVPSDDWDMLTKYRLKNLEAQAVSGKERMVTCPVCDILWAVDSAAPNFRCEKCRVTYCVRCSRPHGVRVSCAAYAAKVDQQGSDLKKLMLANREKGQQFQMCPKCGTYIEKITGCNHITCRSPMCDGSTEFCFVCGKEYINKKKQCSCP